MAEGCALLFPGPAGLVASAAVQVALRSGVSGNAALLFGRICSFNGKPFWELRKHLGKLFGVSVRTITRWFRELVDAALIVNKPAPLDTLPPGRSKPLMYRPWFKWAIGLPEIRELVRAGSREAFERMQQRFEANREQRQTRSRLAATIALVTGARGKLPTAPPPTMDGVATRSSRLSAEDIDRALESLPRASVPPPERPPD